MCGGEGELDVAALVGMTVGFGDSAGLPLPSGIAGMSWDEVQPPGCVSWRSASPLLVLSRPDGGGAADAPQSSGRSEGATRLAISFQHSTVWGHSGESCGESCGATRPRAVSPAPIYGRVRDG